MNKKYLYDYLEEARSSEGIPEEEVMNVVKGGFRSGTSVLPSSSALSEGAFSSFGGMSVGLTLASILGVLTVATGLFFALKSDSTLDSTTEPSTTLASKELNVPSPQGDKLLADVSPDSLLQSIAEPEIERQLQQTTDRSRSQSDLTTNLPPLSTQSPVMDRKQSPRLSMITPDAPQINYSQYNVENVSSLNTELLEYSPFVTPDGSKLYFASNREGGMGGHDIWYAERIAPGSRDFHPPVNLGAPINTDLNEGSFVISCDGESAFFTLCNRSDGIGDCDLYTAHYNGKEWTNLQNLHEVNSTDWDSQPTISTEGDTLYFTSNRPGTLGGADDADIYMSVKNASGVWQKPVNLGAPINTPKREDSPFIVPRKGKLYFSSMGHGGYGKLDFFVAERSTDGTWLEPLNLGPNFNSDLDERMLTTTQDETTFYFSSERSDPSNAGTLDIFTAHVITSGGISDEILIAPPSKQLHQLNLYPNPATEYFYFRPTKSEKREEMIISDQHGQEVLRIEDVGEGESISISALSPGTYFVRVGDKTGSIVVRR
ncbi:MAG: T9SS type A sorting domain-containing protein [Candidatus Kapaibacterium sp.]